jgi:hypothetical protein
MLSATVAVAQQQPTQSVPPAKTPTWTRSSVLQTAVSPDGGCVALRGATAIDVVNRRNEVLWSWNYKAFNRFLAGPLALASSCNVLAFGGGAEYRYTWIVHRGGRKQMLQVSPLPRTLAFSRNGKLLAIGTGLEPVYLFTVAGKQLWKRDISAQYVGGLEFSDDDSHVIVTGTYGVGVIRLDGALVWKADTDTMIVGYSPDLTTFLTHFETTHGPYNPIATLYGAAGERLWTRDGKACAINRAGDRIIANVDGLKLFSRSGAIVRSLPERLGCPVAFAARDQRLVTRTPDDIEEVDLDGRRFWTISVPPGDVFAKYVKAGGALTAILVHRAEFPERSGPVEFYDLLVP